MKNMRKLFALVLALMMVLSLATTAFAEGDEETTGSITISNATVNVKYSIYKVFDLTYSGETNVAYTYTKTGENDPLYTALTGNGSPFVLTESSTANVYNVVLKDDATDGEDVGTWLKDNENLLTLTGSAIADSATVTFEDVEYGYYYVTSTMGTAVTINSAKPDANITDKNEKPTIEKKVEAGDVWGTENSANIGDTVNFKVDITVQTGAKNYVLHDTMSAGLTYDEATGITVKVGEHTVDASNYTVSTNADDDCTFEVSFKNDYLADLDDGTVISVMYSATLDEDAVIDSTGNENTAKLTYGDAVDHDDNEDTPAKTPETEESETVTYTYAIALKKVNENGTALSGATFQFPFYVKETAGADGAYIYAGTESDEGLTNTITTPTSGEIVVKGVASGTYSITETAAPDGYNKLTAAVSVTAVKNNAETTEKTFYIDANGEITETETSISVMYTNENLSTAVVVVVNKAGTVLPTTGGMGTTLFYVLGTVMVLAAAVLLITKKRMASAE